MKGVLIKDWSGTQESTEFGRLVLQTDRPNYCLCELTGPTDLRRRRLADDKGLHGDVSDRGPVRGVNPVAVRVVRESEGGGETDPGQSTNRRGWTSRCPKSHVHPVKRRRGSPTGRGIEPGRTGGKERDKNCVLYIVKTRLQLCMYFFICPVALVRSLPPRRGLRPLG